MNIMWAALLGIYVVASQDVAPDSNPLLRHYREGEKLSKQTGAEALDSDKPLIALNQAARHLGLDPITADSVDAFHSAATTQWAGRFLESRGR